VVHVAAFMLGAQDCHRFLRHNPARAVRVVLGDEAGKRFSDNQADI
jgi:hypothetical protein